MYKVTKRNCPMFGIGPYVCEFICDTASDITTLPTSISEGTGGRTAYDNQKCASGSIAIIAENGSETKQYMLNNQDIWCPYSIAVGNSGGGSGESSITVDFALSETSENPVANKTITAALNDKADTTHTHTANEVGADASGSAASALVEAKAYTDSEIGQAVGTLESALNEKANASDIPDLTPYAKKTDVPNIKVKSAVSADNIGGVVPKMLFCHRDGPSSRDLNECVELGSYFFNGIDANAPSSTSGALKPGTYAIVYNIIKEGFIHQSCHIIHGSTAQLGRMFVRYYDKVLNSWSEWKENYTEAGKPYITGSFSGTSLRTDSLGFQPSYAICNDNGTIKHGNIVSLPTQTFIIYQVLFENLSDTTHEYIIFK